MATVDIIIPAYNASRYLPAALESIAAQTFEDWRIQIVNDGSTDNTDEVIAPYLDRFGAKLNYIKQNNAGVSAARNTAIRASTAEFLAFLDADDVWLPCRLSESIEAMKRRPQIGLSYGLITYINPDGHPGATFEGNSNAEGRIAGDIYMRRVELPAPTITCRRKFVEEAGSFDETMRATEDRDLWLRIAQRHEIAFIPKVIAYYRVWPNSASTNAQLMLKGQIHFIRKHYGEPGCGLRARQRALARVYKQYAEALKKQGQRSTALISALRAVALYPLDMDNSRTAGSLLLHSLRND